MTVAEERLTLINEALKTYTLFKWDRKDLETKCEQLMADMHSPETRADFSKFLEVKQEFNKTKNKLIKANEDENLAWENIPSQSKKEIKAILTSGDVVSTRDFQKWVKTGCVIDNDGEGYFHDGKTITDKSVWDMDIEWNNITKDFITQYPFVIWYNK